MLHYKTRSGIDEIDRVAHEARPRYFLPYRNRLPFFASDKEQNVANVSRCTRSGNGGSTIIQRTRQAGFSRKRPVGLLI